MGSVAGTLERTSVPSPGRIWIASQPMWSGERAVGQLHVPVPAGQPRRERDLDAGQRQPALARREAELRVLGAPSEHGPAVRRQLEPGGDLVEQARQDPPLARRAVSIAPLPSAS